MPAIAQSEHGKLTVLPLEFKTFIAAKEQQARSLAGNLSRELPPEVAAFYQAALAGD